MRKIQFWVGEGRPVTFAFDNTYSGRMEEGGYRCEVRIDGDTQVGAIWHLGSMLFEFSLNN